MAGNFNAASAWEARKAQRGSGFDAAAAWSMHKSERTEHPVSSEQTQPAEPEKPVTFGSRIANAVGSIWNTAIGAPLVLGEGLMQTIEDKEQTAQNLSAAGDEHVAAAKRLKEIGKEKLQAQTREQWMALDEEEKRLKAQIAQYEVSTPISSDSAGMKRMQKAGEQKEAALEGTGKVGRWVGENLISVGQNAATLPLALIHPAVPLAAMGTIAAGSRAAELSAQGVASDEALLRGTAAGAIEAVTEKIPLDNILDVVRVGGRSAVKNLLRQAGMEATEEAVSYTLNFIADKAANDPNASFTLKELANAAGSGAFSGGLMGGGAALVGNAVNRNQNTAQNEAQTGTENAAPPEVGNTAETENVDSAANVWARNPIVSNRGETEEVIKVLSDSIPLLQEQPTVAKTSSQVFQTVPGTTMAERARKLFEGIKGIVTRPGFGDIEINNRSVKDDLSHGVGAAKAATISTVPQVIQNGQQISFKENWKGRGYDGYIFGAPVEMDGETVYVAAVVKRTSKNRFYLHEVVDSNGNIIKIDDGESANPTSLATNGDAGTLNPSSNGSVPDSPTVVKTPPVFESKPVATPPIFKDGKVVNPDDSVGAAPTGFDTFSEASLKYGAIEPGENPARVVDVPISTDGKNLVSRTARTAMEADATPDAMVGDVAEDIMSGKGGLTYIPITNTETAERARQAIERDGYENSLLEWSKQVASGKVSADLTAMGALLYNAAANSGNTKQALDILSDYASMARSGAQAVQAARILKTLTPEGKLYYAQKSVDKIQQELNEKYGAGKYQISISDELADAYLKAETEEARTAALDNIYKDVAKQIPTTWAEKWNTWRYLSMLANPRTHIRNVAGNFFFAPVRMVKNVIATAGEGALSHLTPGGIERTKAALNYASKADRALVKSTLADAANVQDQLLGEGKYDNAASTINENRRIFTLAPVEAMRKLNSAALDAEDAIFSKPAYAGALAGYLKANNATLETASSELLDKARAYAVREAQKATYRDANALSDFVSGLKYHGDNKVGKAANVLMEGVLPFRRTPANILARGVEYSPIGLTKSLTADLVKVKQGKMTAAEAIDNIAAGLTGTGLTALGVFLAAQGLVTGGAAGSDEEQEMADLTGAQNYAVTIGNKNYTLDWLAPEAMPFFVGVELYNQFSDKADGSGRAMEDLWASVGSIASPLMEMSMLSGVQDLLESIANSDGWETIPTILSTAATNYVSQSFPTILGQIERVGDSERETTFVDRTSPMTNDLQYTVGKTANKIPGYDFQQIPYIDAWGRTEDTGTTGEKIVNNMLAPWYSSEENVTEADREIMRLMEAGYEGVAPNRVKQSYEVTYKDDPEADESQKRYMAADEYVDFATIKGETSYDLVTEMIGSDIYKGMTDEQKAEAINLAYTYANHIASDEITGGKHEADKYVAFAQAAKEELGLSEAEYLMLYKQYGATLMNGDDIREAYASGMDVMDYLDYGTNKPKYNTDGKQGYTLAETAKAIQGSGLSEDDQTMLWLIEKPEWGEKAAKSGVKPSVYVDFKVATIGIESDKNSKGEVISGSKKKKILKVLDRMGVSPTVRNKILEAEGYSTK